MFVKEVNIKEALKSSIFVIEKADAPKYGRILPGFYWYHQKQSSYVVRRQATLHDVITPLIRKLTTHARTDNTVHRAPADLKIWVEKTLFQHFLTPTEI